MERNITVADCERANFLENAHFQGNERKCENCVDLHMGECEGKGYTTHDEIMDCMIEKAVYTREKMKERGIDESMLVMSNIDDDKKEANNKAKAKKNKSKMAKKSKKNNRK